MLDLTAADDWKHVRGLMHHVRQSSSVSIGCPRERLSYSRNTGHDCSFLLGDLLEHRRHLQVHLGWCHRPESFSTFLALSLLFSLEKSSTKSALSYGQQMPKVQYTFRLITYPRSEGHSFTLTHGNDFTLKVSISSTPLSLIDDKLAHSMISRPLIGLGYNPSRCITDTKVENLTLVGQCVERLHNLLDGGGEVPPMKVQDINIGCPQLLQARCKTNSQRLGMVPGIIALDCLWVGSTSVWTRELLMSSAS